ncbi:MAG: SGNH/GDSL hydrolase family protein [Myxococcota bacterium]
MGHWGKACLALAVFATACGDDDGTTGDAGGRDSAVADAGGTDGALPDSGPGNPDAGVPDTGPRVDAGPRTPGHMSFVPPGLMPETATRMIVLGDSISAGAGAGRGSLVYHSLLVDNDDSMWPDDTESDLAALTGGTVEVIDAAVGGARTGNLAGQVDRALGDIDLPAVGHTVVVVTIGGNDLQSALVGGNPTGPLLDRAIAAIRAMAERLLDPTDFPDGTSLYLAAVYDPSDGEAQIDGCFFNLELPELVAALDVWRDRYIELGEELGFSVIDALGHFHGHGHNHMNTENPFYDSADPSFWFADCIHPNARGHHELRRLFYEAMNPAFVVE